jgi:hypothetical protein
LTEPEIAGFGIRQFIVAMIVSLAAAIDVINGFTLSALTAKTPVAIVRLENVQSASFELSGALHDFFQLNQ